MIRIALAAVLVAFLTSGVALGQATVVPTDRVVTGISIRASATADSTKIGSLLPGQLAALMSEVPNWYRIDYPDHETGLVSNKTSGASVNMG
jgi:hypothetical protein